MLRSGNVWDYIYASLDRLIQVALEIRHLKLYRHLKSRYIPLYNNNTHLVFSLDLRLQNVSRELMTVIYSWEYYCNHLVLVTITFWERITIRRNNTRINDRSWFEKLFRKKPRRKEKEEPLNGLSFTKCLMYKDSISQ